MSRLRSLRQKIAFLFFVITAAAFSAIWFVVVPQLEQNLKERRLTSLQEEARAAQAGARGAAAGRHGAVPQGLPARIRQAADATDAQVTVRDWQRDWSPDPQSGFYPWTTREPALVPFDEQLAERALTLRRTQSGYGTFRGEEVGMVAQPLRPRPASCRAWRSTRATSRTCARPWPSCATACCWPPARRC